jgi:hypothetical protein
MFILERSNSRLEICIFCSLIEEMTTGRNREIQLNGIGTCIFCSSSTSRPEICIFCSITEICTWRYCDSRNYLPCSARVMNSSARVNNCGNHSNREIQLDGIGTCTFCRSSTSRPAICTFCSSGRNRIEICIFCCLIDQMT